MNSAKSLHDQVNLLPPAFIDTVRLRRVFFVWFVVVCSCFAALVSISIVLTMYYQQERQSNEQLAAVAIPLMDLRRDVLRLRAENHRRNEWCGYVESARPCDDMLQSLAAVATNTDDSILIDSIHVRLPVEYTREFETAPDWAMAKLELLARVPLTSSVSDWTSKLMTSDRIQDADLKEADDLEQINSLRTPLNATRRVELNAVLLSTGVLP